MAFVLTINTDGAAFTNVTNDEDNGTPNPAPEIARMLREAADQIEHEGREGNVLRDINGHVCGHYRQED